MPVPDGEFTLDTIHSMINNFHNAYEARNGNRFEAIPVQGVTYRLSAVVATDKVAYTELPMRADGSLKAVGSSVLRFVSDAEQLAQIFARESLCQGDEIPGPAIVREALSTTYITQHQVGIVGRFGEIKIQRKTSGEAL